MSAEKNCPQPPVYDLFDILGEHLFVKVCDVCPDIDDIEAGKITGILLECQKKEIFWMLENEDVLKPRICAARLSLKESKYDASVIYADQNNGITGHNSSNKNNAYESDHSPSKPQRSGPNSSLADKLFEEVEQIEPEMSPKITGMLLELDNTILENIVADSTKLTDAVQRAKQACINTSEPTTCDTENLGDTIFEIVHDIYPNDAAKISGMLLEMSEGDIQKLLEDRTALVRKMEEAAQVLRDRDK